MFLQIFFRCVISRTTFHCFDKTHSKSITQFNGSIEFWVWLFFNKLNQVLLIRKHISHVLNHTDLKAASSLCCEVQKFACSIFASMNSRTTHSAGSINSHQTINNPTCTFFKWLEKQHRKWGAHLLKVTPPLLFSRVIPPPVPVTLQLRIHYQYALVHQAK